MNAIEWNGSHDVRAMIGEITGRISDRKARLFCVAICRSFEHLFNYDEDLSALLTTSEGGADAEWPEDRWATVMAGHTAHVTELTIDCGYDTPLRPSIGCTT